MKPLIVLLILFFESCSQDKGQKNDDKINLSIKQIHREVLGIGFDNKKMESYHHFLILKEYIDNDGWSNDFIDFADSYRDTAKSGLPISGITICKPFDFNPKGDSQDKGPLDEHSIISIDYSNQTLHRKLPDISSLTFWNNGKPFYLSLLTIKRMRKSSDYYDSAGNENNKWIDLYKDQKSVDAEIDSVIDSN